MRWSEWLIGSQYIRAVRATPSDYIGRPDSEGASDVLPTQAEAIERVRELGHGKAPLVERVRYISGGNPDKWCKPYIRRLSHIPTTTRL